MTDKYMAVQYLSYRYGKLRSHEHCLYVTAISTLDSATEAVLIHLSCVTDLEMMPDPKPARTCVAVHDLPMRTDVWQSNSPIRPHADMETGRNRMHCPLVSNREVEIPAKSPHRFRNVTGGSPKL
jgi:hypothetical protein